MLLKNMEYRGEIIKGVKICSKIFTGTIIRIPKVS